MKRRRPSYHQRKASPFYKEWWANENNVLGAMMITASILIAILPIALA